MALGDVVTNITSLVAGTGVLDIKPPSGVEWVINNLVWNGGSIELWKTNGTISAKYDTDISAGGRFNLSLRCTNNVWYQIKNTSSSSVIVGYDGIQTK